NRRRGAISGLIPASRLTRPRDVEGRRIQVPAAGLAMSSKLAQLLAVKPGDTVTILPTRGRRDPLEVPIAELSDRYIGVAVHAGSAYLSRLVGEEFAATGVQLQIDHSQHSRDELNRSLKLLPAIQSVSVRADVIRNS